MDAGGLVKSAELTDAVTRWTRGSMNVVDLVGPVDLWACWWAR